MNLDQPLKTYSESLKSCVEVALKYHEGTTHRE